MRDGPIILIEDNADDAGLILEILTSLTHSDIVHIAESKDAVECLRDVFTSPFIILCSTNLKITDGYQLRNAMLADILLREKSTPFIFMADENLSNTTVAMDRSNIQGFFYKSNEYSKLYKTLKTIINYWEHATILERRD